MSMVTLALHSTPANHSAQSGGVCPIHYKPHQTANPDRMSPSWAVANQMRSCKAIKVALCSHRGHCDSVTGSIRMRPLLTRIRCTPAVDLSSL